MTMKRFLQVAGVVLLAGALAGVADAAKKAPAKKKAAPAAASGREAIMGVLETAGLKWGSTVDDVKKLYKEKIKAEFAEKMKGEKDSLKMYNLGKERDEAMAEIDAKYVVFDPKKEAEFRSAIVAKEFKYDSSESMIVVPTPQSQWYLFFLDSKLWKLFIAYNSDYIGDRTFGDIVALGEKKYGSPKKRWMRKPMKGDPIMVAAEWEDGGSRLWMEDKIALFGSVVMIYADKTKRTDDRSDVSNPLPKEGISGYAPPDAVIDSIKTDTDPDAGKADIVDKITGKSTYADLDELTDDSGPSVSAGDAAGKKKAAPKKKATDKDKTKGTAKPKGVDDDLIF
jgi:hypothetical protein